MSKPIVLSAIILLATAASLTCKQGWVPNDAGVCISPTYIEGCSVYLSESRCKTCNYRYELKSSGLCELETTTTKECCRVRGANNVCTTCQTGLYLIGKKCQESNILGCLEKDAQGVCINCASDYVLAKGTCASGIKHCATYSDSTNSVCTSCAIDHSLINNICVRNLILGCKNEVDHVCKECYRPFFLSNGTCGVRNCQTYNEYKCIACECGFYLTSDGACRLMEMACVRYQRGICADCLPHFRLKGNKCQMEGCIDYSGLGCNMCDSGYLLENGVCLLANCRSWKDGVCEICNPGFNFKLGKCVSGKVAVTQQ